MKMKRFAALAAVSMLGIQLMGASTAMAKPSDSCSFSSSELEVTLDQYVEVWIDSTDTDQLFCGDLGGDPDEAADLEDIDTVIVVGDGGGFGLTIWLHDDKNFAQADWSSVTTWDVDLSDGDDLYLDGSLVEGLTISTGNQLEVEVRNSEASFGGTTADIATDDDESVLYFYGGEDDDTFDASKSDFSEVDAYGYDGDDTLKGGESDDYLYSGDGSGNDDCTYGNALYGNGGDDTVVADADCAPKQWNQSWGGDGEDALVGNVVAPGAGDDEDICADVAVVYADVADVEWIDGETDGDAGEDTFDTGTCDDFVSVTLSPGDDTFIDDGGYSVTGLAGDDLIKSFGTGDDVFKGGAGDDILKGKAGDDELVGGKGSDQTWGGAGTDICYGEVMNRCEFK